MLITANDEVTPDKSNEARINSYRYPTNHKMNQNISSVVSNETPNSSGI